MDTIDVFGGLIVLTFCFIMAMQFSILHIYTEIEVINKKINNITNPSGTQINTTDVIPDEKTKNE